jgi:hypothetical protein
MSARLKPVNQDWVNAEMAAALAANIAREFVGKLNQFAPLAMTFGLACWAMWNGTALGAYIGLGFAVFAYLYLRVVTVPTGDNDVHDKPQ